jgi:hypothetical protein
MFGHRFFFGGRIMSEISREALLQLAAKGCRSSVENFTAVIADYYEFRCAEESFGNKNKERAKVLDGMENDVYDILVRLCIASRKNNTKPVLPGINNMSFDAAVDCCFDFAEAMYQLSKAESFDR